MTSRPKNTTDNEQRTTNPRQWRLLDLPVVNYEEALDLQHDLVQALSDKIMDKDVVLFLEHPPVFTLGRRGGLDNLMVSKNKLDKRGISLVHVERGGDITYHGPGQIVVYPIIHLERNRFKVVDFVSALEEVMIRVAFDSGIAADRNSINRGVWVGRKKLGSIGIAVRRGISFHGLALNVNLEMEPFCWVNPCGLDGVAMTSMKDELSHDLNMSDVREAMKRHMEEIFKVELIGSELEDIQGRIKQN